MTEEQPEEQTHVWIRTEQRQEDKPGYVVTLEVTEDDAVTLTPTRVMAYAMNVLTAVQRAEYDAAVLRQMLEVVDGKRELAGQIVIDLRKERAEPVANTPLSFVPGVSQRDGRGFLTLLHRGKPIGQWELDAAREHAMMALEAVIAADLDSDYFKVLTSTVGIDPAKASVIVQEVGKHRGG